MQHLIGHGGGADIIHGDGVYLRPPRHGDYRAWALLRERSRGFLEPWEPAWGPDELSRRAYRARLRSYARARRSGAGLAHFLFHAQDHQLLGGINISHIRRGAAQSGSIGYWMGESFAGNGLMRRGLCALIDRAFGPLELHRLEAACLPENARSIGLLEGVGFSREGYMRSYLKINGAWRDHLLFALVRDDWVRRRMVAG